MVILPNGHMGGGNGRQVKVEDAAVPVADEAPRPPRGPPEAAEAEQEDETDHNTSRPGRWTDCMSEMQKIKEMNQRFLTKDEFSKEAVEEIGEAIEAMESNSDHMAQTINGKELNMDATTLLGMGKVVLHQMKTLADADNRKRLVPKQFFDSLKKFATMEINAARAEATVIREDDDTNPLMVDEDTSMDDIVKKERRLELPDDYKGAKGSQYAMIYRKFPPLLNLGPCITYIRPLLEDEAPEPIEKKVKKERVKRDVKEDLVSIKEKLTAEHATDEVSVSAELSAVRKCLKRAFVAAGSVPICFFSFVIDPHEFNRTVENMFYVSFLVKDGRARLSLGPDGLPLLAVIGDREREEKGLDDRSANKTHQMILPISPLIWEGMKESLGIEEPAIRPILRKH